MRPPQTDQQITGTLLSTRERDRLVRLCTRLTGDPRAAEDLAQETLLTAWQRLDQVTDPNGLSAWLATIARNHYRHWVRSRRRRQSYILPAESTYAALSDRADLADELDLELFTERTEFAQLLDRAIDRLPAETQALLIDHYLEEIPQAELAAQLGIYTGAVAGRLHRGKAALRELLVTEFQEDALALGLVAAADVGWQTTRIWCISCGQRRLRGKFISDGNGQFLLQCDCGANHGVSGPIGLLDGIRGYQPAWTRAKQWLHTFLQGGLHAGEVNCPQCQSIAKVHFAPSQQDLWARCPTCDWRLHTDLASMAGNYPQSIHFGRRHPRRHTLPSLQIDYEGAPAAVIRTQSLTNDAQLDLIFHRTTFTLLHCG